MADPATDYHADVARAAAPARRLLYVTPYFPPQSRVGALRPLKFLQHLRGFGWDATVLCDLRPSDARSEALLSAVPAHVDVHFAYSRLAASTRAQPQRPSPKRTAAKRPSLLSRLPEKLGWSPEFVPLGEHAVDIPHATRAGRRLLEQRRFDAILVNADPYAAMLVGDKLSRRTGVPVVHDLRDPWSVCDLRRDARPGPQRRWVDRTERRLVENAGAFVLNSQATLAAYRAHYPDVPSERFHCIRNHGDAALVSAGTPRRAPDAPFTMLFLGNFRRFLHGDAMLAALARLRDEGATPDALRLRVTGRVTPEARALMESLGIDAFVDEGAFVPYLEVGAAMDDADLLVALSNASRMRIPAKFFDYAVSRRPLLVIADAAHTELRDMATGVPGGYFADIHDVDAIASAMRDAIAGGAAQSFDRSGAGYDSLAATRALAAVLDHATRSA